VLFVQHSSDKNQERIAERRVGIRSAKIHGANTPESKLMAITAVKVKRGNSSSTLVTSNIRTTTSGKEVTKKVPEIANNSFTVGFFK